MNDTIETQKGAVTLRPAQLRDVAEYKRLRLKALRDHPTAYSSDYEEALARPDSFWVERLTLDQPGNQVMNIFAWHNEQLVGMSAVILTKQVKTRHSGLLVSIYVDPEWRGFHISDAMVSACEDWARSQGATIIKLAVTTNNTPAIHCYTRCGYQVYGVDPEFVHYQGKLYDELLMYKKLS